MLVPIDEVVFFDVVTHNPSTGAISDADSTPTFDVYEESTDTGLLGATNFTKRTSLTGNYRGTFTASAANGFEAGKWYSVIASATVNSIAGKTVAMHFRCAPAETQAGVPKGDTAYLEGVAPTTHVAGQWPSDVRSLLGTAWLTPGTAGTPDVNVKLWNALTTVALPLVPTVAGRTLDVSAGGEAGVDWANVGTPGSTVNLSATTVNLVNTVTTVTNQLTAAQIATGIWQDATAGDFTTASSIGKALYTGNFAPGAANGLAIVGSAMTLAASQHVIVDSGTVTTVTNQLTAAQIATGIWQDTTAGDFTVASSIGKSLYTSGNAPGAASGLALVGSNMGTVTSVSGAVGSVTGNVGGNVVGSVASVVGAVGSVTGLTASNLDATVSSRLASASYTAPDNASVTAIKAKTDSLTFTVANRVDSTAQSGLSTLDAAGVRSAIGMATNNLDTQIGALPTAASILAAGDVDGYTLEQTLKLCLAALAGKLSGAATTTVTIRAADDSKARITATVDSDGNRSAVTLDAAG